MGFRNLFKFVFVLYISEFEGRFFYRGSTFSSILTHTSVVYYLSNEMRKCVIYDDLIHWFDQFS